MVLSFLKVSLFLSTPSARRATFRDVYHFGPPTISIHALREEGDRRQCRQRPSWTSISIHALREEGDRQRSRKTHHAVNFYPRPPRGGRRRDSETSGLRTIKFLSTPSARRATTIGENWKLKTLFLSTPSARRATENNGTFEEAKEFLSTPSARRATTIPQVKITGTKISIHALREEGDPRLYRGTANTGNFYPRPPRGGRPL